MRAKRLEQEQARALRANGWPIRRIADELGVAQSSVSVWVRDVDRPSPPTRSSEPSVSIAALQTSAPADTDERKRCSRCEVTRPITDFNRSSTGHHPWCRACFSGYHRGRRAIARRRRAALVRRAQEHVRQLLQRQPCTDCGLADPVVLEFDHVGEKRATVASLVGTGASPDRLDEELQRCEVVCVNCHRRRTAARAGHRRSRDRWWETPPPPGRSRARNVALVYNALERSGCVECGVRELAVLDFDHVGRKTANVTDLARSGASVERLRDEMAQCVVRCANCHRRRTAAAQGHYRSAFGAMMREPS